MTELVALRLLVLVLVVGAVYTAAAVVIPVWVVTLSVIQKLD